MNKTCASFAAAVLAGLCLTGCGAYKKLTDDELIEQIVTCYGSSGDQADRQVSRMLKELEKRDERQGTLWRGILDYWQYVNTEMPVNTEKLPDDLPRDDSLALTVLGYKLNDDGTMQDELIKRLTVALDCAGQYPDAYVICTGGGTALNAPDATEGDAMGEWLLEHGLDESRLIVENRSRTTAENAQFSYEILLDSYPQVDSVAVISSSYHIAWGSLLFEAEFMKSASENQTPEIHVVSNCACQVENAQYRPEDILRWETGGMLQMIGNNELARDYYMRRNVR